MIKIPKAVLKVALKTTLVTFLFLSFFQLVVGVAAENLESDSFIIQFGNFNVTSGEKASTSFNVTDTVGQLAAGPYGEYGSSSFFLGSGFQYIYQINQFSFVISDTTMDLGQLTANSFNSDSHTLTITTRGAGGYNIFAYEEHELQLVSDASISVPDTNCDSSCTISSAGIWNDTNNPGFGYNMSGDDIPTDFQDSSHYRPFATDADGDEMQVVMGSNDIANSQQSTVTYKATIDADQAAGIYETAVVYVAVPGY